MTMASVFSLLRGEELPLIYRGSLLMFLLLITPPKMLMFLLLPHLLCLSACPCLLRALDALPLCLHELCYDYYTCSPCFFHFDFLTCCFIFFFLLLLKCLIFLFCWLPLSLHSASVSCAALSGLFDIEILLPSTVIIENVILHTVLAHRIFHT